MSDISLGNIYEFNKTLMVKEPLLDQIMINRKCDEIAGWCEEKKLTYAMLLSNERSDFTLFNIKNKRKYASIATHLAQCFETDYRGKLLSIDLVPDSTAYEIWVKQEKTNEKDAEAYVYYLFSYDEGVIEV